jgi:hypothetical protein
MQCDQSTHMNSFCFEHLKTTYQVLLLMLLLLLLLLLMLLLLLLLLPPPPSPRFHAGVQRARPLSRHRHRRIPHAHLTFNTKLTCLACFLLSSLSRPCKFMMIVRYATYDSAAALKKGEMRWRRGEGRRRL